MGSAESIDEVISKLTEIIERSKAEPSRLGYFAALYRKVTVEVARKIEAGGHFDDDARMERFDILFANRYLDAYEAMRGGRPTTLSWAFAFRTADDWWPIVLQHLLLGMNAHINLDLGIAAIETTGAAALPSLRADFDRINALLGSLVAEVTHELAWVWPPLRSLTRLLGDVDDAIIDFSMKAARDSAWDFTEQLALLDAAARGSAIRVRDGEVLALGRSLRHPGFVAAAVTKAIRLGERGSVSQIVAKFE